MSKQAWIFDEVEKHQKKKESLYASKNYRRKKIY